MTSNVIHTATRDEILDSRLTGRAAHADRWVTSDHGPTYRVLGASMVTPGVLYAMSDRTGLVLHVQRSGKVTDRNGNVRVRITMPRDTGDKRGTLAFLRTTRVGGTAPAAAFDL